ncbi:MAG: hypothetical protein ACRDYE_14140 [Acidimicrobiales bacterium]
MNKTLRRLLIPGAGLALATTGFAFMATGAATPGYGSTSVTTVNGYDVYNVSLGADGTTGRVGYIKFDSTPLDNNHTVNSWPSAGQVNVPGVGWFNCTSTTSIGGSDDRTNSYTDVTPISASQTSFSPQASWICDVRSANSNTGIDPGTSTSTLTEMIIH